MVSALGLQLIQIIYILLFIYIILSWFPLNPSGIFAQIHSILDRLFNPILSFLRRYIPPLGPLDLSVIVLFIILLILRSLLIAVA